MIRFGLALFALAATPALAQYTTNCTKDYFGNTRCTTNPSGSNVDWGIINRAPNVGDSFRQGFENGQRQRALRDQRRQQEREALVSEYAQMQQRYKEQDAKALGLQAGKMVADGDCPGAQKLALDAGNFDLANSIKEFCRK